MSDISVRRLRQNGSMSMLVTIPRDIIKDLGLKNGDTAFISREGDEVRVKFGRAHGMTMLRAEPQEAA